MKTRKMLKTLLTVILACAMFLCPMLAAQADEAPAYKVAIIKQLDHASLDEIAKAVAARLDEIADEKGVTITYEITSGQGDQSVLKQLADQAIADGVNAIIPIATTAAQVAALSAEDTQTPVVYAAISDPAAAKLTGIDYVKNGISIWIFPEGTRNKGKGMLDFKEGSMKIAEKTGCPIIPVAFTGTAEIFEKHIPWVKRSHVTVTFGEPIDIKALDKEQKKFLGSYTRQKILDMLPEDMKSSEETV